jgi:hypothetical protein
MRIIIVGGGEIGCALSRQLSADHAISVIDGDRGAGCRHPDGADGIDRLPGQHRTGFGAVGPMGHFGDLHAASKIALTAAMWIGRLEVLTVLALLRPEAWRSATWGTSGVP